MPSEPRRIQLGLCCLNTTLRQMKLMYIVLELSSQRVIQEKGIEELKARAFNGRDLIPLIEWNEQNGIEYLGFE